MDHRNAFHNKAVAYTSPFATPLPDMGGSHERRRSRGQPRRCVGQLWLPALVAIAGEQVGIRLLEFFAATIESMQSCGMVAPGSKLHRQLTPTPNGAAPPVTPALHNFACSSHRSAWGSASGDPALEVDSRPDAWKA